MIRRVHAEEADTPKRWLLTFEGKEGEFGPFLSNPLNVCLAAGDGGAFFVWHGPGIYESHVSLAQRGKAASEIMRRMLAWMRENMGAAIFWAAVPYSTDKQSRKVRMFARLIGWRPCGFADLPHGRCQLFLGE